MPFYFYEEELEGFEPADVVERSEYDSVSALLAEAQEQRDQAIDRAVSAESEYASMRKKYADTFLHSPAPSKPAETSNLPQSLNELFS